MLRTHSDAIPHCASPSPHDPNPGLHCPEIAPSGSHTKAATAAPRMRPPGHARAPARRATATPDNRAKGAAGLFRAGAAARHAINFVNKWPFGPVIFLLWVMATNPCQRP